MTVFTGLSLGSIKNCFLISNARDYVNLVDKGLAVGKEQI